MAKNTSDNAKVKMKSELSAPVAPAENTAPKKSKKKTAKSDKPNVFKRIAKGFKGVISELKKVTWPGGKDVVKSTGVVLVVVVAFFLVLFAIDYILSGIFGLVTSGEWTTIFID